MAVDTHIDQARTRARTERAAVDDRLAAYEAFVDRVADLDTARPPPPTADAAPEGATHLSAVAGGEDRCRRVRQLFAETVRPHSVEDADDPEPLLETVREEFTGAVAAALAPTTPASFTPDLKGTLLAEARTRRAETAALRSALDRERDHLADAGDAVAEMVAWLVDADETPLSELGFDALRRRHGTLADHRDRCGGLARDRQRFLRATTSGGAGAGVRHRSLVPYLYGDGPVDHPVLATVVELASTCRSCQRVVRAHLVRRA